MDLHSRKRKVVRFHNRRLLDATTQTDLNPKEIKKVEQEEIEQDSFKSFLSKRVNKRKNIY